MKAVLDELALQVMPGCGDGMGARLIGEAAFRTGLVVYPQDILAASVHPVRAALTGLKGGPKPPMASPDELANAIRSADYVTRNARWPDPR